MTNRLPSGDDPGSGDDDFEAIPEQLVDVPAGSVLASAITGMSMKIAAGLAPGETVLVQGATGVAGRLAVKVARLLGAGRIVATGRDDEQLRDGWSRPAR